MDIVQDGKFMKMELSEYHKEVARTFSDNELHNQVSDASIRAIGRRLDDLARLGCNAEFHKKWIFYHRQRSLHEGDPFLEEWNDAFNRANESARTLTMRCYLGMFNSLESREVAHALLGLGGELHELLNAIASRPAKLVEEIGDMLFYLTAVCNTYGITLGEAMAANVAKLRARYPDGFSADKAVNRDVAAEAAAMGGGR